MEKRDRDTSIQDEREIQEDRFVEKRDRETSSIHDEEQTHKSHSRNKRDRKTSFHDEDQPVRNQFSSYHEKDFEAPLDYCGSCNRLCACERVNPNEIEAHRKKYGMKESAPRVKTYVKTVVSPSRGNERTLHIDEADRIVVTKEARKEKKRKVASPARSVMSMGDIAISEGTRTQLVKDYTVCLPPIYTQDICSSANGIILSDRIDGDAFLERAGEVAEWGGWGRGGPGERAGVDDFVRGERGRRRDGGIELGLFELPVLFD